MNLIPSLREIDEDDYYWVHKTQVVLQDDCIKINLHVTSDTSDFYQEYELICLDVRRYRFGSEKDHHAYLLEDDHPAIMEYIDTEAELYYQADSKSRNVLIQRIMQAHYHVVNDWINPLTYINTGCLSDCSFGQIAKGPSFLMHIYHNAIKAHCQKSNVLSRGPHKDYYGVKFNERNPAFVGICFGQSYILCSEYKLENKT